MNNPSTNNKLPIGVFDSGVGGLTVAKAIRDLLPNEDMVYFGDSAHVPYGNKSKETITRYSVQNASFLSNLPVKMIVVACNTSTAVALPKLKTLFSIPMVGVVEPGCIEALKETPKGTIGVVGTKRTIASKAYSTYLRAAKPSPQVVEKACPLFVPLIEEGMASHSSLAELLVREYLDPLAATTDSLILGCTHYALLKPIIKQIYPTWKVVDSASATALAVREALQRKNLLSKQQNQATLTITTNDLNETFVGFAKNLFPSSPITTTAFS